MVTNDRLWYVAYGSNMLASRLRAYIEGTVSGPYGRHQGSSDRREPGQSRAIRVDRGLYFAGQSKRWRGPVAFLGLAPGGGPSLARAYLLSWRQVADIAAQENGDAEPCPLWPLPAVNCYHELPASGKYNVILRLADHEQIPTVTLTTSRDLPIGQPTPEYFAAMRQGLLELGDLSGEEIGHYLDGLRSGTVT